jgi:hypothetical protein
MTQISEQKAIDATTSWRNFNSTNSIKSNTIDTYLPKAFTIPLADVQAVLAQDGVAAVRVYFGYSSNEPAPTGPNNFPMNLIVVGVDAAGKDMLTDGQIYDNFGACPFTCDASSVLCSTS